jgi:hypothetical protein
LLLVVKSVFCGNLVEVLKTDGESKLIKYVTAAGLADAIWHIIYINEINIENKSKTYVEIYSKIN